MANENAGIDGNFKGVSMGVTDDANLYTTMFRVDPTTLRLKVDSVSSTFTGVVDNEAVAGADAGILILGTDGSNYQVLHTDATGNLQVDVVTGGGGGTQYDIQDVQGATNTGTVSLVVRNDTLADLSGGDGAYSLLQVNATGALYVDGSGVTQPISAAALPLPAGASTSAKQLADGHNVTIDNAAGAAAVNIQDGGNTITVDGTVAVNVISGFATSALQLADGHNVTIDNISTDEVYIRGGGTAGSAIDGEVVAVQGIASGTAMAVTESSPIAGFATSALQLADGHNVTIDNAAAGSAVNIQDGGNTITVDGSVTVSATNLDIRDLTSVSDSVLAVVSDGTDTASVNSAVSDSDPDLDGVNLLGVNALLSARKDVDTTIGLTAEDSTHNALHVAITDGEGVADVDASNQLLVVDGAGNTLLGTIDGDTGTIAGAVAAGQMQVDIVADGAGLATSAGQLADGHNVTIDNAAAGSAVNIQDGGNTITVDGTVTANVAAGTNVIGKVRLVTATGDEITEDTDDSIQVTIVADDVGIGGGTQYATNAVAPDPSTGTAGIMERDDILSALTPAAGDWVRQRSSAEGALWTQDFNSDAILADTTVVAGAVASGQMQVDIVADGAGLATSAGQLADGHNVTIDNISTDEVYIRGGGTAGSTTDGEVVAVQGIASGTPMAVTESSPISGFATSAKQLADGHNVTIDNGAAGSAVNIQDGGNSVTVDSGAAFSMQEDGAALTALQLIDNIVPTINGPGAPTIDSYTHLAINLGVVTDSVLVASAANKQIWVYGITYTCSVAGTVSFQDEDNTAITGVMDHAANSGLSHPTSGNFAMPIWKLATNKDLEVDTVTCSIDGWLDYAIVSV